MEVKSGKISFRAFSMLGLTSVVQALILQHKKSAMTKYTFPFPKHCTIIINNFRILTQKKLHYKNISNLTLQGQPNPITECNFLGFAEFQPANESLFFHTWCKTLSFSLNCSIRNVPRKQNTIIYTKIGCQEDPAAFHHPSTTWEEILCGSWREKTASAGRCWMKTPPLAQGEGLGVDFWNIHSSTTCHSLNLLLVTPVLEQDCCKLKFHPFLAAGICLHCVNIFNASSCKSLPKPFPPSLIFSILRFPDSCSTSKALSAPWDLQEPWNIHEKFGVFLLQGTPCRCDTTNSRLFWSRDPCRAWHTKHPQCAAAGITEHGRSLQ